MNIFLEIIKQHIFRIMYLFTYVYMMLNKFLQI